MRVGGYSMDLYCDILPWICDESGGGYHQLPDRKTVDGAVQQVAGRNERQTIRKAVRFGWVRRNGKDYCPYCAAQAGFHKKKTEP